MYHSHHNAAIQQGDGLLGAFIVDPKTPAADDRFDREYIWISDDTLGGFTINGHGFPATVPVLAAAGETVRIRFMNQGTMIHPWHLHGNRMKVVARDGFPLGSAAFYCDTLSVSPGERYDVNVVAETPGVWAFHCHILTHAEGADGMFGMVSTLIDGAEGVRRGRDHRRAAGIGRQTDVVVMSTQSRREPAPGPAAAPSTAPSSAPATEPAAGMQKLLLATDLSEASSSATEEAFELAERLGTSLLVVSVIDPGSLLLPGGRFRARVDQVRENRELAAQALVERGRAVGVAVSFLVWTGDPGDMIVAAAEAEHADMIIVGSHGRGAVGRLFLGSVSEHVVRNAPCPVLVVRPKEPVIN